MDGIKEGRDLRFIQGLDLLPLDLWQFAEIAVRRIEWDIAVNNCLPESAMQDALDVLHGFCGEGGGFIDDFPVIALFADFLSGC